MEETNKFALAVLDHGYVDLVDGMGNDWTVVKAARHSYHEDLKGEEKDEKLLKYLLQNHHTSPFEMVEFTFEVKLPIFVIRQWHRHRTWSYNEVSARYTRLPNEFYIPKPEHMGTQSKSNKQMREMEHSNMENAFAAERMILMHSKYCYDEYERLLSLEIPRELARMVLPSNIYTVMIAKVDLNNLMKFLTLRLHEHAQFEIQEYARAMFKFVESRCPITAKYFREMNPELKF